MTPRHHEITGMQARRGTVWRLAVRNSQRRGRMLIPSLAGGGECSPDARNKGQRGVETTRGGRIKGQRLRKRAHELAFGDRHR